MGLPWYSVDGTGTVEVLTLFYFFADTLERGMSADFCNTLEAMTPVWALLVMMAGTVIFALIGCVIGKRMFKKHFEKAGIV